MKSVKILCCSLALSLSTLFSYSCDFEDSWDDEEDEFFEERTLEIDPEVILTRLFENLMEQNIEAAKEDYSLFIELFGEDFLPFKIIFRDDFESEDFFNFGFASLSELPIAFSAK